MNDINQEKIASTLNISRKMSIEKNLFNKEIDIPYIDSRSHKIKKINKIIQFIIKFNYIIRYIDLETLTVIMSSVIGADDLKKQMHFFSHKKTNSGKDIDDIFHEDIHKNLQEVYTLSYSTLKEILKESKCYTQTIPSSIDAIATNKLINIALADKVLERVLERLEDIWKTYDSKKQDSYKMKQFIKYISFDEYYKFNNEQRASYLNELDCEKSIKNQLLKVKTINENIREKYLSALIKSSNYKNFILRKNEFKVYQEKFDIINDVRSRYFLLQDLIKVDKKTDYLEIIQSAVIGLDNKSIHNLLKNNSIELREIIADGCKKVCKENAIKYEYPDDFNVQNKIKDLKLKISSMNGVNLNYNNQKIRIDNLRKKGLYTEVEAKQLEVVLNNMKVTDSIIIGYQNRYKELETTTRFRDTKNLFHDKDKYPSITLETMLLNKVFISGVSYKKLSDGKSALVIHLLGFDNGSGYYTNRTARKKVFGTTELFKRLIVDENQGSYVLIDYELLYTNSNEVSAAKYENILESTGSQSNSNLIRPDFFRARILEEFKNKADYFKPLLN